MSDNGHTVTVEEALILFAAAFLEEAWFVSVEVSCDDKGRGIGLMVRHRGKEPALGRDFRKWPLVVEKSRGMVSK